MDVLLADDDVQVRDGLAKVLRKYGFRVETAENGLAAFAELQQKTYHAIVSDVMMPYMDGIRLYERLATDFPELAQRVVFITGYAGDLKVWEFLDTTGQPVLTKPFDVVDLVRAVRAVAGPDE
jgi:CheY-like chemotaxis protein